MVTSVMVLGVVEEEKRVGEKFVVKDSLKPEVNVKRQ